MAGRHRLVNAGSQGPSEARCPASRASYGYQPDAVPVAYRAYRRLLSLPSYSQLSDQDVQDVVDAVVEVVEQSRG